MTPESGKKIIFDLFMVGIIALFFGFAITYEGRARLMPLIISTPALVLALGNFLVSTVKLCKERQEKNIKKAKIYLFNQEFKEILWIILLIIMIFIFGFLISIPLYIFIYLKFKSREPWHVSLSLPAGFLALIYLLFIYLLKVQLYKGYFMTMLS